FRASAGVHDPTREANGSFTFEIHRRNVAVKIRLKRLGKIRAPYYRIVVADSRTKRDGRVIEEIGKYHPTEEPSFIEVDSERAQYWLSVGAQPTEQVLALLKLTGDWGTFKGEKGAKSTVRFAEAKEEFQADEKKKPVLKPKAAPAEEKAEKKSKPEEAPAEDAAAESAPAEARGDEAPAEVPTEEAPAAESPAAEAPADQAESTDADTPAESEAAEASADDAD